MPLGMTVFEGGAELGEYAKVALLSMMAWHIYTDAVRRRRMEPRPRSSSRICGATAANADTGHPTGVAALDDPVPGHVDPCNNAFVTQLKNPKDRALTSGPWSAAHLTGQKDLSRQGQSFFRGEKRFVDEQYKRYLSRVEIARSIVKLGYSTDKCEPSHPWYRRASRRMARSTDGL
jgi:hypothetical protein